MDGPPDLTIVLLGNSGVGKSASGNTILGEEKFESRRDFEPVTTVIQTQTGQVFGKKISVTDTPGILDAQQMIGAYCERLRQDNKPRLFLVVVKIDRFTTEQRNAVDAAIRVIGDQELQNSYMLFTNGDSLNNMSLEEFIQRNPEGPLALSAAKFAGNHLFNNNSGRTEQVRQLLIKSGHLQSKRVGGLKRRLVLLGLPGDGKSSSANTILGSDEFNTGCSFGAVTTEAVSKSAEVEGHYITVVDTPGFSSNIQTPEKLYEEILKAIRMVKPGPHVFIIVVKIGRINEASIKLFQMLPRLFGKDSPKFTMILFTHEDELRGQSIQDLIQREKCVSDLVNMCDNRYCLFNNLRTGNRQQVTNLLVMIDEVVRTNKGKWCEAEMFYNVQSLKDKSLWEQFLEWFKKMVQMISDLFNSLSSNIRLPRVCWFSRTPCPGQQQMTPFLYGSLK